MPVNWNGRDAIRDLSLRSRGDFQLHELLDLIPLLLVRRRGIFVVGTPLQPFPGFPRSDVLACGRPSLVRYYAHTEQAPLNLNTYMSSNQLALPN